MDVAPDTVVTSRFFWLPSLKPTTLRHVEKFGRGRSPAVADPVDVDELAGALQLNDQILVDGHSKLRRKFHVAGFGALDLDGIERSFLVELYLSGWGCSAARRRLVRRLTRS